MGSLGIPKEASFWRADKLALHQSIAQPNLGGRAAVKLEVIPNSGEAVFRGIPRSPLDQTHQIDQTDETDEMTQWTQRRNRRNDATDEIDQTDETDEKDQTIRSI